MKKRNQYIIAVVAGVALTTGLAACGWHSKTPEERADYMVEKVTSKLDLTDNQVVELEKLKKELLAVRQEFVSHKEETRKAVDELLDQPVLDQQRLLSLFRQHTDAVNEKAPAVVSSVAGFYDSLTPEQQAVLREKIEKHRERSHGWHH